MILPAIIDRITGSELNGSRVATLFTNMAEAVERLKLPGAHLTLDFLSIEDEVQEGDLIPQINLVLKRAHLVRKVKTSDVPEPEGPPIPAEAATDVEPAIPEDIEE